MEDEAMASRSWDRWGVRGLCSAALALSFASAASAETLKLLSSRASKDRIHRFRGFTGDYGDLFALTPPGSGPSGMALGPDGNVYAAHRDACRVVVYNAFNGARIGAIAHFPGSMPTDVAFLNPDVLLVTDENADVVRAFSAHNGKHLGIFASANCLVDPGAIEIGLDGNVYVLSQGTGKVLCFRGMDGRFLHIFCTGVGYGDILFGPDGNLYASDTDNHRILRFNGWTGAFQDVYATGNGNFKPDGLAFDPDGNLLAGNTCPPYIMRFTGPHGAMSDIFGTACGSGPVSLLYTPLQQQRGSQQPPGDGEAGDAADGGAETPIEDDGGITGDTEEPDAPEPASP
jgi:sugar lactone lactonase YvrE